MQMRVPIAQPYITEEDIAFVSRCLAESQVSGRAPVVREFEQAFGSYLPAKHAVACSNGTAGLHLAVKSLQLAPGSEVIIPSLTMMSPVFALLYEGLKPKLVDVHPRHWVSTAEGIEEAATKSTKAILVVHTYGNMVAMDEVREVADKRGLFVIEDCAEALGATYRGKRAGTFGDMAVFSFFANKLITCGEGGMVCTSDDELAERVVSYHDLYFGKKNKFLHDAVGFNFRMSALQAALGRSQLLRIDKHLEMVRMIAADYRTELEGVGGLELHDPPPNVEGSFWMYSVVLPKQRREAVVAGLSNAGIETRPFFVPAHRQPACSELFAGESYPVSEDLSTRGLNLPSGLTTTTPQVKYVSERLRTIMG